MEFTEIRPVLARIVFFVVLLPRFTHGTEYCSLSQYSCLNGRCIPNQWKCDDEDDCQDNSDELECASQVCIVTEEFSCDNGQCIPSRWQCDGEADCTDNSDENRQICAQIECNADHFSCGVGMSCIPETWKCDGHEDCATGLDEAHAICGNGSCNTDEFMCKKSKRCITSRWLCDLDNDCEDGSDEVGCGPVVCTELQWQCPNGYCIPAAWHCDGDMDCTDGSDEENCTVSSVERKQCGRSEFHCNTSMECIHQAWKCDGDEDCLDGSDEKNCGDRTCADLEYQCLMTGKCIPRSYLCDGITQCDDASDETLCYKEKLCDPQTAFDCSKGDEINCIDINLVCNGYNDCGSAADESASLCTNHSDPCNTDNGGCSHICVFTRVGYYCKCHDGYMLDEDEKLCIDIDECQLPGICSQKCENKKGGFKCICIDGYEWDYVDQTCRAIESPSLLFASRHDLRKIQIYSGNYHLLVDGLKSAVSLDFDYENKILFWSDLALETINMAQMANESQFVIDVLLNHDVSTPDGIAFDWIHRNLYWTDAGNNRIDVLAISEKGHFRKTLFNTNLDEPRAIVLDPRDDQSCMYWTDWGMNPKIERAFLDSSSRIQLVTKNVLWPNGLAIDYESNLLFWVDAKLHTISSCDLDGLNQRMIITSYEYLRHPFAITVFEDFVYWTDWEAESIFKINKFNDIRRQPVKNVAIQLHSPMDLRIYHKLKQPSGINRCMNSGCSHICLPRPASTFSVIRYSCFCPDYEDNYYKLSSDEKTCVMVTNAQDEMGVNEKTTNNSINCRNESLQNTTGYLRRNSDGHLAGAVIIVILLVCLALIIISIAVYRCNSKRAIRIMNFDNPAYHKTTEEDEFGFDNVDYQPSAPTLEQLSLPLTRASDKECV